MPRHMFELKIVLPAIVLFAFGGGVVAWMQDRADFEAERLLEDQDNASAPLAGNAADHGSPALQHSATDTATPVAGAHDDTDRFALPANSQVIASNTAGSNSTNPSQPFSFDLGQTSWDDPFDMTAWHVQGWEFESHGMFSTMPLATAEFRRPYRRLMFECSVEPLSQDTAEFRARLLTPETHAALIIAITAEEMVVTQELGTDPPQVIKRVRLAPGLKFGDRSELRVAATGNRLIASWNGKIALTCDQPALQSGRDLLFEFVAPDNPIRISHLRIEGE